MIVFANLTCLFDATFHTRKGFAQKSRYLNHYIQKYRWFVIFLPAFNQALIPFPYYTTSHFGSGNVAPHSQCKSKQSHLATWQSGWVRIVAGPRIVGGVLYSSTSLDSAAHRPSDSQEYARPARAADMQNLTKVSAAKDWILNPTCFQVCRILDDTSANNNAIADTLQSPDWNIMKILMVQ